MVLFLSWSGNVWNTSPPSSVPGNDSGTEMSLVDLHSGHGHHRKTTKKHTNSPKAFSLHDVIFGRHPLVFAAGLPEWKTPKDSNQKSFQIPLDCVVSFRLVNDSRGDPRAERFIRLEL